MDFSQLLDAFTGAVESGDGAALVELFAEDGVYHDGFYGPFEGGPAIAEMLAVHFWGAAENFRWDMLEPVCDGKVGYARYVFSYDSKLPDAKGRRVVFEGMSQFQLEHGKIKQYREVFDRGVPLVQLGFPAERIGKSLARWTGELCESEIGRQHLGTG